MFLYKISNLLFLFSEIRGLKKIHKRLSTLPNARRACPHSIDPERVLSSIKKIISEHSGDILPKNIIMPTIIHYTHEEPPPKVQEKSKKFRCNAVLLIKMKEIFWPASHFV